MTLAQKANLSGAILVTTPQEIAMMDVRKAADLFAKLQVPLLGVVENMSYLEDSIGQRLYPFGKGGGQRLADELGVPLLASLPLDPQLGTACDKGIMTLDDLGANVETFATLAESVLAQLSLLQSGAGLQNFALKWEEMSSCQ